MQKHVIKSSLKNFDVWSWKKNKIGRKIYLAVEIWGRVGFRLGKVSSKDELKNKGQFQTYSKTTKATRIAIKLPAKKNFFFQIIIFLFYDFILEFKNGLKW